MTVSSTTTKVSYTGNGSTSVFAYTFKIFADTEIKVWVNGVLQTLTTHYTVSGAGSSSGGNVTFETASIPASTHPIVFGRNIARTQVTDYVENDTFPAETHEAALDKLTLIAQEIDNKLSADIFKFAETVTDAGTVEISLDSATRSSKILSFDSTGGLVASQEIGVYTGNWAASTAYVVRDLIKDTSNNNIYICLTAHSSSGTQPISSNADVAKWALIVDAASASTSATAAATSATAAATSATAAATSATASATSSTSSATSATASASSATGAASSASAASTSAAAAATSYDNFDDRFLGAKSSDPTVDNDGDALATGAIYFNSSNNVMMVYTGSAWVRTTPTSSDQTNINALSASAVIADMDLLGTSANVAAMALLGTSDAIADMNVLGTSDVVADLNTLGSADVVADLNTLGTADVVADLNTLGTADVVTDMNVLATADVVNDMNVLGTSANVTAMNTLGTSANVTAMSTVSGAIANVNTTATNIASVNNFAEVYRIDSSDPSSSLTEGDLVFRTDTDTMRVYNGSAWQDVAPTSSANIFGTVAVSGQSNVVADSTTDTLTLAGSNITITTDASTDTVTFTGPAAGASNGFAIAMAVAL
jgi:hypothetical protein